MKIKLFKEYSESINNILKPKSKEEIRNALNDIDIDIDKPISIKVYNPYQERLISLNSKKIKQQNPIGRTFSILTGNFMDIYSYVEDYYNTMNTDDTIRTIKNNTVNIDNYALREGASDYLKGKSDDEIEKDLQNMRPVDRRYYVKKYNLPDKFMPSQEEINDDLNEEYMFGLSYNDVLEIATLAVYWDMKKYKKSHLTIGAKRQEPTPYDDGGEYIYLKMPLPSADYEHYKNWQYFEIRIWDDGYVDYTTSSDNSMKFNNALEIYNIIVKKIKPKK